MEFLDMKLHVHIRREWGSRWDRVTKFPVNLEHVLAINNIITDKAIRAHYDCLTSHRKNSPSHICRNRMTLFAYSTKESAEATRSFPTIGSDCFRIKWLPRVYEHVVVTVGNLERYCCSAWMWSTVSQSGTRNNQPGIQLKDCPGGISNLRLSRMVHVLLLYWMEQTSIMNLYFFKRFSDTVSPSFLWCSDISGLDVFAEIDCIPCSLASLGTQDMVVVNRSSSIQIVAETVAEVHLKL